MPGKTQENPTIFGPETGEGQNLAGRSPQRCLEPAYSPPPLLIYLLNLGLWIVCGSFPPLCLASHHGPQAWLDIITMTTAI